MLFRSLDKFLATVSCVTCLPTANLHSQYELSGLAKYLPAVGLLIGGLLVAVAATLNALVVSPAVSAILIAIAWIIFSGGIHFDGLMDTADGIFSHRSRERILEIMKDSRVGNFGVITGFAVLLLKIAGLLNLGNAIPALMLIPAWARWCETFAIGAFPYAREEGMGKIWHDSMRYPADLVIGAILPLLVTALCVSIFGVIPIVALSLCTIAAGLVAAFYLDSILSGHTGDTYGAVVELAEAGGLLLLILLKSHL